MRILQIDTDCTDNGLGLRTVIYVAGCWQACIGCHNKESWETNQGIEYTIDELVEIVKENPLADVTISGGDPLTFQYESTLELVKQIKYKTNKNIWIYTGYTYEQVFGDKKEILQFIDVLVDGRFEIGKRDLTTQFRGSSNQRLVDVPKSLKYNKVVELKF